MRENTEVFLCLSASYWFEEISITQDRTANLQYCFTSLLLRLEKIAAGYMQIHSTRGSFLSASSSHSAEKYFWHILSVSFVNQRMRCWKAHVVKPLPSTRPNNLPDKSWAHSSGSQVRRAVCSRSPTFWSFSSLKSTYTALCGLVTECLLESGRQSCVKDVPGINTRWLCLYFILWFLLQDATGWRFYERVIGGNS